LAHHDASEAIGKQTISRETTTNVTTPMERTVVTKDRTTKTWSDGTTTYTDSATNTAITVSNDVDTTVANDSFSGQVDQMSYLTNLNKQLSRGLNMDAFRKDGATNGDVTVYINATGAKSSMADDYRASSKTVGLSAEKAIKPNWRLGAQYNQVHSTMDGTDSNTAQDKNHAGLFSVYTLSNDVKIVNNLGYASNDIKSSRTVENVFDIDVYVDPDVTTYPITESEKDMIAQSCQMDLWQYKDGKVVESEFAPEILKNKYNNQQKKNREKAYQLQSDPIFMKYQRGEATEQQWLYAVEQIKLMYPYQV
jgi:hypothetical protein